MVQANEVTRDLAQRIIGRFYHAGSKRRCASADGCYARLAIRACVFRAGRGGRPDDSSIC